MRRLDITLAQLQVLVSVAEMCSLTAAAERLHMSQSAVSHSITGLERALGVTLLVRDRHGARLTAIGERVTQLSRGLLDTAHCIQDEASSDKWAAEGSFRIGSFPSISTKVLPFLIGEFSRLYPGVDVTLFEGTATEVRTWLDCGIVDLGVVILPSAGPTSLEIASDEFVVVVSQQHRLASLKTVGAADLLDDVFLLCTVGCESAVSKLFSDLGGWPKVIHEIRDMQAVFPMVRANVGTTIVPELALPGSLRGLSVLRLTPSITRSVALASSENRKPPSTAELFLTVARAHTHNRLPHPVDPQAMSRHA